MRRAASRHRSGAVLVSHAQAGPFTDRKLPRPIGISQIAPLPPRDLRGANERPLVGPDFLRTWSGAEREAHAFGVTMRAPASPGYLGPQSYVISRRSCAANGQRRRGPIEGATSTTIGSVRRARFRRHSARRSERRATAAPTVRRAEPYHRAGHLAAPPVTYACHALAGRRRL